MFKTRVWPTLLMVLSMALAACSGSALDSGAEDSGTEDTVGAADSDAGSGASEDAAPAEATGETVTVGLINPITGPFAALGEDTNDGFQLYLDEHDGQLAGHPVEVLSEDTGNDAAVASDGVRRLLNDGADVMLGFVNSGVAYGASDVIRGGGVPLIITTAGADGLTQGDAADNIFRVSYTSSQDAMPLGDYACNELGYQTIAIVGLDYAFGWEAAGGFAKAYEDAGCDITQELYAPLGTQDWAPFVQQISSDVDAVWAVIAGSDAIRFLRSYSDFGVEQPLLGHGSLTDEQILPEEGDTAAGVITTLHYSGVIDSPENAAFVEAFEAASGRTVSQYAEHGYATGQIIEAALEGMDEVTPESLIAALGSVSVDAPRGPLSFDEYGQAVYTVYVREVAQDDEGVWVNQVIDQTDDVSQFWTYGADEWLAEEPLAERRGTWASN